ncbi:hypothetical protein BKA70DRAFT_1402083 [Coprinopsis sp. MPI-PUGE-AT-0042]|nr:hypothetical protein BKA70DRAFT_1402083 [Coprinopsis sp. MPI-PUGE-AT-0042]
MERAAIQLVMQRTGLLASKSHTWLDNTSIFDHWSITDWRISSSDAVFQMVVTNPVTPISTTSECDLPHIQNSALEYAEGGSDDEARSSFFSPSSTCYLQVNSDPSYASGLLGFTSRWLRQGPNRVQGLRPLPLLSPGMNENCGKCIIKGKGKVSVVRKGLARQPGATAALDLNKGKLRNRGF